MQEQALLVFPVLLSIVIYMISVKDGKQVCDNYILVAYLYALFYLALLLYFIGILRVHFYEKIVDLNLVSIIVVSLIYIVLYATILSLSNKYVVLKHFLSIAYILAASIILAFVFELYAPSSIVLALGLSTVLFIFLSIIAWKFQDKISTRIPLIVFLAFLCLIIAEILIGLYYPNTLLEKAIILVVLVVVCYILLVRTKRLIENEKSCTTPDYVPEGIRLLACFNSILTRILDLFGRRKLKSLSKFEGSQTR
jgi:FtsH-binding integral membrane protein